MIMQNEKLLDIRNVCMYFGGVHAVEGMNIQMDNDEILGIIGPNGSGKSTLINVLTGVYKPTAGEVFFNGQNITGLKQHKIAELGIARTFQNLRVFTAMTVRDNVVTGNHINIRAGFVDSLLQPENSKTTRQGRKRKPKSCSNSWVWPI